MKTRLQGSDKWLPVRRRITDPSVAACEALKNFLDHYFWIDAMVKGKIIYVDNKKEISKWKVMQKRHVDYTAKKLN